MATALESPGNDGGWIDFCERHAKAAAQDYSKSCVQFISMNLSDNARASLTHKDFLRKYLDCFTENFEVDFCKRRLQTNKISNGNTRLTDDNSECNSEEGSPKMQHKPFFRRYPIKCKKKTRKTNFFYYFFLG